MKLVHLKEDLWVNPELITSIGVRGRGRGSDDTTYEIMFSDASVPVTWTGDIKELIYILGAEVREPAKLQDRIVLLEDVRAVSGVIQAPSGTKGYVSEENCEGLVEFTFDNDVKIATYDPEKIMYRKIKWQWIAG